MTVLTPDENSLPVQPVDPPVGLTQKGQSPGTSHYGRRGWSGLATRQPRNADDAVSELFCREVRVGGKLRHRGHPERCWCV